MFLNSLIVTVLQLFSDCLCWSDWNHVITVNGANGSDSESCFQGRVPCATFNMALKGLNYSNSIVIYVSPGNYTLEYGEINIITGMDQIAIIGSVEMETVVKCDTAAGLYIVDCTNVAIKSLTFIGCGYENGLEAPFNPHVKVHLLPAALCFSSCQNVSVCNVTVRHSNGSGLLFKNVSRYATVHNSAVISSGYNWSQTSSDIAIGGIVFVSSNHHSDCYFSISDSNIVNNNYNVNSSECTIQAVAAIAVIVYPSIQVSVNSCLITNNSRALYAYTDDSYCDWNYKFNVYKTAIFQNENPSIIKGLDALTWWCSAYMWLLDSPIVDSFIIVSDESIATIAGHLSNVLTLTVKYDNNIFINIVNSSLGNYSIIAKNCSNVQLAPAYCGYYVDEIIDERYCPPSYSVYSCPVSSYNYHYSCYDNHNGNLCGQCKEGYSVAVNSPYLSCVPCNDSLTVLKGWGLLIILEFVPVTIMVALIAILSVNLNQGSLKAYIFFCQIITIPFPAIGYPSWLVGSYNFSSRIRDFALLPFSIWNLGFISFPSCNLHHDGNKCSSLSICISPNTTPLGAITFWYVIGFYPFLLLALIYGFIAMYDKGYKSVVCFGRPLHRFLARFWRMFNIQPSFTHTIASTYTLCFTQLAATSLKILHAMTYNDDYNSISTLVFMYDGSQKYFHGYHGAAATLALLVLMIFIVIPTVYLLAYPFQWFQRCFNKIRFKKDFLISVTDIFTGPYKDGTQSSWDYRYFAGIYFGIQLLLMMQSYSNKSLQIFFASAVLSVCGLKIIVLILFRPYKRNIHTFSELIFFLTLIGFSSYIVVSLRARAGSECSEAKELWSAFCSIMYSFMFLVSLYCFVWTLKKCKYVLLYQLAVHNTSTPVQAEMHINQKQDDDDDDDMFAHRLMSPQSYDEHHVPVVHDSNRDSGSNYIATTNYKTF